MSDEREYEDGVDQAARTAAAEAFSNPDRHPEPCNVYWGSHGCGRPRGHEGEHWCDCCECDDHERDHEAEGCVAGPPYYGAKTKFYGDDA